MTIFHQNLNEMEHLHMKKTFEDNFRRIAEAYAALVGSSRGKKLLPRAPDTTISIHLPLRDICVGVPVHLNHRRYVMCNQCEGKGIPMGGKLTRCKTCGGDPNGRWSRAFGGIWLL